MTLGIPANAMKVLRMSMLLGNRRVEMDGDEVTYIDGEFPSEADKAVIAKIDLSPAAQTAWERHYLQMKAFDLLQKSNEPRDVMVRTVLKLVFTELNDLRELLGKERTLESQRIALIYQALNQGLGEV